MHPNRLNNYLYSNFTRKNREITPGNPKNDVELHCLCSRISWAHKRTWRGEPGHVASSPFAKSLQGHLLGKDGRSIENPPFQICLVDRYLFILYWWPFASWIMACWDIFYWYEMGQNMEHQYYPLCCSWYLLLQLPTILLGRGQPNAFDNEMQWIGLC